GQVIVAMLFLSSGRHAGPDGDVEQICAGVKEEFPQLQTHCTGLLGTHSLMETLLVNRINTGLRAING
ncbi:CbiX/SirB N-terminal domain-containing protein, partial [Arthrospira platensis SPKY1]|nr:CbiX/SirB N-terminal domain-containing protein [Arthrospira platensis SPKY1]